MKVAFVGKGGSGKTTLSVLFSQYVAEIMPTTVIDADLNVHIPNMLGVEPKDTDTSLSNNKVADTIKRLLIANNKRIKSTAHFKKSTPPARGSGIVDFNNPGQSIIKNYLTKVKDNYFCATVGTYNADEIGTSCYHNNLSILENILSHSVSSRSAVVVDMVAGIDAFASTLHAQFDAIIIVIEPTQKSSDVTNRYLELAHEAGITDRIGIVVNKAEDSSDTEFVEKQTGLVSLGTISRSIHLKNVDRGLEMLNYHNLSEGDCMVLENIYTFVCENIADPDLRLRKIWELHKKYSNQDYIKNSVGNLEQQIDTSFSFKDI